MTINLRSLRLTSASRAVPLFLVCAACDVTLPGEQDGGVPRPDGGTPEVDAGEVPPDGGAPTDAGPDDAGPNDAGPNDAGPPPSGTVVLSGRVRERHYVAPRPAADARGLVLNADCDGDGVITPADSSACAFASDAEGSYAIEGLPPGSILTVNLDRPGETCDFGPGAGPCSVGAFSTVSSVRTGTNPQATADLYSVRYQWLLEQAVRCGVAPSREAAHSDLVAYASILGTLRNGMGQPLVGVPASGIQVSVNGFTNSALPVCFLEVDDRGTNDLADDTYRVALNGDVPLAQSTATGMFLIFKTRNAQGFGVGTHTVSIANFGSATLTLNSGKLGLVTVSEGVLAPDVERIVDFEQEIMPIFARNGCTGCHAPGGPGAIPPAGVTNDYLLDYTADANTLHRAILGPSPTSSRVDYDIPEASLLVVKPLYEDPPNHPNASFETLDHPDLRLLVQWIGQGAPRYSEVTPPVAQASSLTEVIRTVADVGCTNCHTAQRFVDFEVGTPGQPYGGLPLDGCIPFYTYPAAYAPTDNGKPVAEQPAAENQRCVYWHLTTQLVDDDPYYSFQPDNDRNGTAGEVTDARRVNVDTPEYSQLLRNPYCGPDTNGNGAGDSCEDTPAYPEVHPYRVFYSSDDGAYVLIQSWIDAGAANDGANGASSPPSP